MSRRRDSLALVSGFVSMLVTTAALAQSEPARTRKNTPSPKTEAIGHDISDVAARVLPSVVSVSSTRAASQTEDLPFDHPLFRRFFEFGPGGPMPGPRGPERGLGSGVIIAPDLVVTNAHVVENATTIHVVANDNRELDAEVVGADPLSDLAVLRLKGKPAGLTPARFGSSADLELGDIVLAIGNPFGVGQTVTMGIVSAKGRADVGITDYEDFIQTDAAINPGNSGGALVNMRGEVVGIPTAILSRTGGYMGIGFAVPSSMVKPIVDSLIEHGRVVRGYLGVSIQPVDRELSEAFKLPKAAGALIAEVEPKGPADKAGLRRGDVVVAVGGVPVRSAGQLRNEIASAGANKTVSLEIIRDGKRRRVDVRLAEMPSQSPAKDRSRRPGAGASDIGELMVAPVDSAARQHFGIGEDVKSGVVVTAVKPRSPVAEAGVLPGDVIQEVDRKPVASVEEFRGAWERAEGDVLLWIHRQGRSLYVVVDR